MHPDRVGVRSALLVSACFVGVAIGALAAYGCSAPTPQQREPLPIAADHRTPRLPPAAPPPAVLLAAESPAAPPADPRPAVPAREPDLRVRIAALRSANATPRLTHPAGSLLMSSGTAAPRTLRTPVDVRAGDNAMTITEAAGTPAARTHTVPGRQAIDLQPPAGGRMVVAYAGTDWPGSLRVVPLGGAGGIDLVVSVPLERYLPGVIARELYKGWGPETYRAQAIAARSFAICERAHWATLRHYDLIAGEASQAWIGEVKDARPRQAVEATRGMVLVFEDRVVPAYYSSTCGGTPANAVDALTRNPNHGIAPLLAGTDATNAHRDCCRSAPKFRWEQSLPVARILAQLRRWSGDQLAAEQGALARAGAGAPAPRSASPWRTEVAPATSSMGGPVESVMLIDGAPGNEPTGPDIVAASGGFPAGDEIATDAPLDALARISGLQRIEVLAANQAGRPSRVRLVDARGVTLDMRAEDFRRAVNYAPEGAPVPRERLNSSSFQARVDGATVRFTGAGFGHGVGMCQFGAESMAQRGATAAQILRTYYPDAVVRKAY